MHLNPEVHTFYNWPWNVSMCFECLIPRRHVEIFSSDTCTCLITRQVSPTLKRLVQYRFSIMSFQWIYKQLGIPVVLIIDHKKKQQQKSAKHQTPKMDGENKQYTKQPWKMMKPHPPKSKEKRGIQKIQSNGMSAVKIIWQILTLWNWLTLYMY